jgi:hypothetical protein
MQDVISTNGYVMPEFTHSDLIRNPSIRDEFFALYDELIEQLTLHDLLGSAAIHIDNRDRIYTEVTKLDRFAKKRISK